MIKIISCIKQYAHNYVFPHFLHVISRNNQSGNSKMYNCRAKKGFVKESGTGGLPAWTKLAQKFIKLQLTFYSSVE